MTPPRIHLVSTLKNEGPYLVEWIAWYKTIGVTDFTLFSNDCTDGTNLMLDRLDVMGEVRHLDNPLGPRMDPQRRSYSRAGRMEEVRTADWVLVVDADEFVHVTTGDGTLPALIDACGEVDAISLGWQPVGSGGATRWVDAPVTTRFTYGASLVRPENNMVAGFKTLFRPQVFDYFGVHRPKFDKKKHKTFPKVRWVNGSGVDIADRVTDGGWRFGGNSAGYAFGRVNHYAVKSREEFLLKRLRGSANTKNEDRLNDAYWDTFDLNSTKLPPLNTAPLRAEIQRLLSDADLATLRRGCVETSRRVLAGQLENDFARDFALPSPEVMRHENDRLGTSGRRILCVGTHHKTGTMWIRSTLHTIARKHDIHFMQFVTEQQLEELPEDGPVICVNWHSGFPSALLDREDVFGLHVVRDPRDVLMSGMRYHMIAPTARERFLRETRPEWGGQSYQQYLCSLPDDIARLSFEMEHKHAETVREMLAWDYGRPNVAELRYEDLIEDESCRLFEHALCASNIPWLDVEETVSAFWDNALFGGLKEPSRRTPRTALHVQSGRAAQWQTRLPREVAELYAPRFGRALRHLGYAQDDSWVALCPPASAAQVSPQRGVAVGE